MNCGTCIHFKEIPQMTRFGRCERIPMTGDSSLELSEAGISCMDHLELVPDEVWMAYCRPDTEAYTADASQYASSLMVTKKFGCVHHEAAE